MSWVKKRGQSPAAAPPPVQMYNPNQPPAQEWQQQPQANYWQQQQPQYQQQQQYSQQYYQQPNSTTYQQQQQHQQSYGNLQYNQQFTAQNNVYGAQQQPQQQPEGEGWGSNWGWGDEDNSNLTSNTNSNVPTARTNSITESFANDESWNWPAEESNNKLKPSDNVVDLKSNPPVIDRITGKRGKLETPQWSVESQLSQESSDDILQTSESDKSRMLSRSSTISHSPISGHDLGAASVDDSKQDFNVFENKEILSGKQINTPPPLLPQPPQSDDLKNNPYKRATGLAKYAMPVNLETLPDNSEQPDHIHLGQNQIFPTRNNIPENNETPINDRNQYLETGQLSDVDLNNFSQEDTLPPPGLRRMVLGQMEQQDNPPSFSTRVIPGQFENAPALSLNLNAEPPEGLHRMIPGESSSPEQERRDDSEPELGEIPQQTRSATIGADTPPTGGNRSDTIGADTSPDPAKANKDAANRVRGASGSSGEARRTTTLGKKIKKQVNRRDSVEGQNVEGDLSGIVNSIRNLTVGDHPGGDENVNQSEHPRRHSRQEQSSDSEREPRGKSPRERRYRDDDKGRVRGRYSPDDYRDKKYEGGSSSRRRYKDRRYEEDTDYFSDKERRHRDDREYERKYNSLRKDKDKDRRKRDDRYGGGARKNDYYGRYEEDYENGSRSRASSRSDSMHESYRDRDRGVYEREKRDRRHHRDKERHRRHKDPYNPYAQSGYGYDVYSQYYQQYQYYENLRKTNPQAYAQLYRKYYQEAGAAPPYMGEDRASVHSGRSSANEELAKDRYTRQSYYSQTSLPHLGGYYRGSQTHSISGQYGLDESSFTRTFDQTDNSLNYEDTQLAAQRLTPAKFSTAHAKASIASGKLVRILPHYPLDGQAATVELCNLETLLYNDEEYHELKRFPGPLVKGTTHKKTIIEYCENKIKDAAYDLEIVDQDSYVLMWELLILLIRQNGMVVGTDIAELLLKNQAQEQPQRAASVISSVGSAANEISDTNLVDSGANLKEDEVTNKFREYLLYGSCKEALEWAMKHGLWGHALFLASKLDKRTYANVLMRFANGLTMNDPLQTLYQLLSGRTPAAVTCVADDKWGDWRPHLAMILSNSTQRPELNCRAITILGDTLMGRGSLYAAQFCYLMAEVGFSSHGSTDAKLVLLGSDHNKPFLHFATNEAIHMTEIYEYACSLNDDNFTLVNFQRYKHLLATRLSDVGLLERSLSYLEKIANFIVKNPTSLEASLVNQVATLADRLKYYDPVGDGDDDEEFSTNLDSSRPDNSWLKDLRKVQNDYNLGLITQETSDVYQQEDQNYVQSQDVYQQQQFDQYQQQQQQQQWVADPQQQPQIDSQQQQDSYASGQYVQEPQQQYWSGQQQWGATDSSSSYLQDSGEQQQSYYGGLAQSEPADDPPKKPTEDIPQPRLTLPNQTPSDSKPPSDSKSTQPDEKPTPQATSPQDKQQTGNGWFGGIFSKLSLKPKNQMKLPDDKNPSIVWDADKKKWTNTDGDGGDGASEFKPPPKMSEIAPKLPGSQSVPNFSLMSQQISQPNFNQFPAGNPDISQNNAELSFKSSQPNMFKLQGRGRNLKKSYIDVFNPNASKQDGGGGGSQIQQTTPRQPQMNFFTPQPVHDPNAPTDFLTPGGVPVLHDDSSQKRRGNSKRT